MLTGSGTSVPMFDFFFIGYTIFTGFKPISQYHGLVLGTERSGTFLSCNDFG